MRLLTSAISAALWSSVALAQPSAPAEVKPDKDTGDLIVPLGEMVRFSPRKLITDVFIADEAIVLVRLNEANFKSVFLTGRKAGTTRISLTFDDNTRVSYVVVVRTNFPRPELPKPDEPVAKKWSPEKAAAALDAAGVNWTRDRKCVTCHTNMTYLMARPLLKGDAGWTEVRKFMEDDVARWARGGKPRGDAYVVATAAALAFADAHTTDKLSPATRGAFEKMWAVQRPSGEWNWIKCDWPPMEHDDYFGAVLAAVAVGTAPQKYAESDAAKPGVEKLRAYLTRTPAPDLHHRAMLLWASGKMPGLMTADGRKKVAAELRAKQRPDGGWCLPSLGDYTRHDKTANDPAAPSDGYATGLALLALRHAGVPADDPAVRAGAGWLKANQRESGRWFTRSLNTDKAHYVANAGTAFAVLALSACGEAVAAR